MLAVPEPWDLFSPYLINIIYLVGGMRNPDSKHWVFLRDLEIPLGEKSRVGILNSRLEKEYGELRFGQQASPKQI